jgi:hypothetical protein
VIEVVAVVPHPPLLVEELAGRAAVETADLRTACRDVARRLAGASPRWIAVGADRRTGRWGPDAAGTFAGFGADVAVTLGPDTHGATDPGLPLPLLVAGWLRGAAGDDRVAIEGVVVAPDASPQECRRRGEDLAAAADGPVALLVLGDGAATHTLKAPGAFDPRAEAFDAGVTDALATADTTALARLDPDLATDLWAAGRAPWQVLAGAAGGVGWRAELCHSSQPYGVAYHVALWERAR